MGDELEGGGQLLGVNENVVGKAEFAETGDATEEIGAGEETLVRFVLGKVAEAAELVELREVLQAFGGVR